MKNYFKRSEIACKCGCGFSAFDFELLQALNELREAMGFAIVIESGCRCREHNSRVGGSKGSKHMLGIAADVRPTHSNEDFCGSLKKIHEYFLERYPEKYGIAIGSSFVHIDVRESKARWAY